MTNNKFIAEAAGLALANVDKKKAARAATKFMANVAEAVSKREGSQGVRLVAAIVARSLDEATKVPHGENGGHVHGRHDLADPASQAELSVWPMGPSLAAGSNGSGQVTTPRRALGWPFTNGDDSPLQTPDDRPSLQPAPAAPAEAVLQGPMDTVNCGDYSFSLYTAQLIISMLGTSGAVGGEYHVPSLPVHVWTRLIGRGGSPLPIVVRRDHGAVSVRVGNVGISDPTASPTR